MNSPLYFFQDCPTCGRPTRILVEYLGRRVCCRHCSGEFVAEDSESHFMQHAPHVPSLLDRVDKLLGTGTTVVS